MKQVIGYVDVDLEGRFEYLRAQETNLANFVSDLARTHFSDCDIGLIHGGMLRSNAILSKGNFTLKMVYDCLPDVAKVVRLRVPGDILLQALENSVS